MHDAGCCERPRSAELLAKALQEHRTGDGNLGWKPRYPQTQAASVFYYNPEEGDGSPEPLDPRWREGGLGDVCQGYFRWTRGGLRGIDFGGEETRMDLR